MQTQSVIKKKKRKCSITRMTKRLEVIFAKKWQNVLQHSSALDMHLK